MNKRLVIQIEINPAELFLNRHYQQLCTIVASLGYQIELYADLIISTDVSGMISECPTIDEAAVPCITIDKLSSPKHLINYLVQLLTINELKQIQPTKQALIDYHSRFKLLLLAYSQPEYRKIGPYVAQLQAVTEETLQIYKKKLLTIFALGSSKQNHSNVVQHLQGYFRPYLNAQQKQQLVEQIEAFRQGQLSLLVVINQLNDYLALYPNDYLRQQYYLTGYRDILQHSYLILEDSAHVE
ncbi:DUF1722 domain-containing protein [Utexia brackfieldae]|uniref:DUF1722 domain-containing protein n=1 Tax=Utexia brackfieldae TaxID=3074108 RepID=UPI00370DCFA1